MYFRNYRLRNRWLDKFLKSPIRKNNLTGNLVNGPKHSFDLNTLKVMAFESDVLSDTENLKTVC